MNQQKTKRCNPTDASIRQWGTFFVKASTEYQDFDQQVTKALEELESKWAHLAAPNAQRRIR